MQSAGFQYSIVCTFSTAILVNNSTLYTYKFNRVNLMLFLPQKKVICGFKIIKYGFSDFTPEILIQGVRDGPGESGW